MIVLTIFLLKHHQANDQRVCASVECNNSLVGARVNERKSALTGVRYRDVNSAWAKVEVLVDNFCPRTCK